MTRERHYIPESRQREKPKSEYFAIGHSIKRVEDTRLLTGSGTYADDVTMPNLAHAAVLRSPHAHARIVSIDKSKAEALPGVLCVMTGAEAAEVTGPCADFLQPADDAVLHRPGQGAPRGRGGRRRGGGEPLHRRGRLRADRGRVRSAAGGGRPWRRR